ncbi:Scrasp1p [Elasticomyces elasticus]|nr:Scrasp1p [Elasticomyces elasticus]
MKLTQAVFMLTLTGFATILTLQSAKTADELVLNPQRIFNNDDDPDLDFDCEGKKDGLYPSPYDCTRFFSCSGGITSRRDCASCHVDPVTCPDGRLVLNPELNACVYADEYECKIEKYATTTLG